MWITRTELASLRNQLRANQEPAAAPRHEEPRRRSVCHMCHSESPPNNNPSSRFPSDQQLHSTTHTHTLHTHYTHTHYTNTTHTDYTHTLTTHYTHITHTLHTHRLHTLHTHITHTLHTDYTHYTHITHRLLETHKTEGRETHFTIIEVQEPVIPGVVKTENQTATALALMANILII